MVSQARAVLRRMWKDTCTIYGYRPVLQANKSTIHEEITVITDEPCKLSFSRLSEVKQTDTAAAVVQVVKLFLDESLKIEAGSKIAVKRGGNKFVYACSGEAGIFEHHQEIVLIPWERWAADAENES